MDTRAANAEIVADGTWGERMQFIAAGVWSRLVLIAAEQCLVVGLSRDALMHSLC